MQKELISIVIPVYNVEKYVGQCLDSVLGQTYHNIEVICVDDASTDSSLSVLRRYADLDKRIKIVENRENKGLSFARNYGFSRVKGKYVYFLDSDDYIKLDTIENLCNYAERYETECVYFNSDTLIETEGVSRLITKFDCKDIEGIVYGGPDFFKLLKERNAYSNSPCRFFWKVSYLIESGLSFENGRLAEDQLFSLKAVLGTKRILLLNEVYHIYRRHEGTLSTTDTPSKMISVFKNYCDLLCYWKHHMFPTDVNEVISDHLKRMHITAKRLYYRTQNGVDKECFMEGFERHLFEVLILQEYERSLENIDDKKLAKIRRFKKVIVFGAGRYAAEIVERLNRNGVDIDYLAVTKMYSSITGINNIPVYSIQELYDIREDAIVILGIGKISRNDVVGTLNSLGFRNYLSLDKFFVDKNK